jgi:phospholipid N-methyltransferase
MKAAALTFAQAVLDNPLAVGAVLPSSRALARALVAPMRITPSTAVVELGPGTGAITAALFDHGLSPARYLGVELSGVFVPQLQARFPQAAFSHDSAENLLAVLRRHGFPRTSYVVASLPWTWLAPRRQLKVLRAVKKGMVPDGHFLTFTYLPRLCLSPRLRTFHVGVKARFRFARLRRFVWANLPPAFVWDCWNA